MFSNYQYFSCQTVILRKKEECMNIYGYILYINILYVNIQGDPF